MRSFNLGEIGSVYIASVYLPYVSVSDREVIIAEVRSRIEKYSCMSAGSFIIIGGVFNFEFVGNETCSRDFNNFLSLDRMHVILDLLLIFITHIGMTLESTVHVKDSADLLGVR